MEQLQELLQKKEQELQMKELAFFASAKRIRDLENAVHTLRNQLMSNSTQQLDLQNYMAQLDAEDRDIEGLQGDIRDITQRIEAMNKIVEENRLKKEESQQRISSITAERDDMISAIDRLQEMQHNILSEKYDIVKKISLAKEKIEDVSYLSDSVMVENKNMEKQLAQKSSEYDELQDLIQNAESHYERLQRDIEEMELYEKGLEEEYNKNLSEITKRAEYAQDRLITTGKAIEKYTTINRDLSEEKSAYEEKLSKLEDNLSQSVMLLNEKDSNESEAEIEQYQNEIVRLTEVTKETSENLEYIGEQISSNNELYQRSIEELKEKEELLSRLLANLDDREQEYMELLQTSQRNSSAKEDLIELIKANESEVETLRRKIKELNGTVSASEELIKNNLDRYDTKEEELNIAKHQLQSLEEGIRVMENNLKNANKSKGKDTEYKSTIDELIEKNRMYQSQYHDENSRKEELEKQLETVSAQVFQLQNSFKETVSVATHSNTLIEALTNDTNKNNEIISDLKKQLADLNDKKSSSEYTSRPREEFEELQNRYKELVEEYTLFKRNAANPNTNEDQELMKFALQLENIEDLFPQLDGQGNYETRMIKLLQQCQTIKDTSLSLNNFEEGQMVMLRPVNGGSYEVFNKGCPNYFLNPLSYENFAEERNHNLIIFGRIVLIEETVASYNNPYGVRPGDTIHLVFVAKEL
eukprot:TRINITY_DN7338_c0_g1_i1.p1 TRINITY_DN7338_c0_g1~~TRINITY_DN7338_c0_g1_i1.p1  ORF type:complete len:701 (-),score=192.00 TRINITY_DN7338_c0_g1_i1:38-2140(-)